MSHSKKIMRNSGYTLAYKMLNVVLSFITRKIFLIYLSSELLGLNSLFTDLLGLLNLADMGLGMALQYNLYKPLAEKDNEKVAKLLNAAKKIYNTVGLMMIVVGIILSFFIQYLIKDNPYSLEFIRLVFIINVISNASTYFFAHKRLFLHATEDVYITNIIDSIIFIVSSMAKILVIVFWKNYYLYIIIDVVYSFVSNAIVSYVCDGKYKYLSQYKGYSKNEMKVLGDNMKELIPNKIGAFVFNNTDNTIISAFLGLTMVVYYTNYFTITNQVFLIAPIIAGVVKVSFGNVVQEQKEEKQHMFFLNSFQLVQFFYSSICGVLLFCMLDEFVGFWYGKEYILSLSFVIILTLDFFVHSMYQPLSMLLEVIGDFSVLKKQQLISMTLNLIISIGLITPFGIIGPIVGTLIADIITLIFRIYTVLYVHYNDYYKEYIIKLIKYYCIFLAEYIVCFIICSVISLDITLVSLIIKSVMIFIFVIGINVTIFYNTDEFKYIKNKFVIRR